VSGDGGGVSAAGMRGIAGEQVPGVIIFTSTRARSGPRTVSVMRGRSWGVLEGAGQDPSPRDALRRSRSVRSSCTGLGPQGGQASLVASRASTLRARNGTRVGERGHMRASAVAWSVIFTNTKTWPSPNHVSLGSGFRGDSVGTDASVRQARSRAWDRPRNVATRPATAGASPPPPCEASLASSFQA
jgi:hypothetical protein